MRDRAPDIAAFVFTTRAAVRPMLAAPWLMLRPTVSIEMDGRRNRPRILRGYRLGHFREGGKIAQFKEIDTAGLPLPKWTEIAPETSLDPAEWGPYVVTKPSQGKRGAFVRTHKTGRVRFRPLSEYPEGHCGRDAPMIAQRFVYTGRWPVAYRVLTYFGTPVMAIRYDGRNDLAPLETPFGFNQSGGRSIVASARGSRIVFSYDAEVLELARRASAVYPEIPSLGIDIVREAETEKLYLMEMNGGNSWALTSDAGVEAQAEFDLNFYTQFDALDLIANRSIAIARQHAR